MDESRIHLRIVSPLLIAFGFFSPLALAQTEAPTEKEREETVAGTDVDAADSESTATQPNEEDSESSPDETDALAQPEVGTEGESQESREQTVESVEDVDDDLAAEEDPNVPRPQSGEPALTDTSGDAPLEDQEDWLNWPFSKKNQEYPRRTEPHRWASLGGFVGSVTRSSASDAIRYRTGIAWGGYLRPELVSWMGLRLSYREERIPVEVEKGAFDYGEDSYDDEFEQPDLELVNLGARLEPTLVLHPRVRLRAIAGWSWLWFRAPYPRSEEFELKRTFRQAVQMDFSFGLGASLDIIQDWIDVSLDSTYSIPGGRTGTAYEPAQIVRDGSIRHIAPLPELQNSLDVLVSLGVIL